MNNLSVMSFYESLGEKLIDEANYPEDIKVFLDRERMVVSSLLSEGKYRTFVECGCMHGRNLWILDEFPAVNYIGIDIVNEFIKRAENNISTLLYKKRALAIKIAAEEFVIKNYIKNIGQSKTVCFFPFNSFGNATQPKKILKNLQQQKLNIAISTYKNTVESILMRLSYYKNCNYKNIVTKSTKYGTRFLSEEGLNSTSYSLDFFKNNLIQDYSLQQFEFSESGVLFLITTDY